MIFITTLFKMYMELFIIIALRTHLNSLRFSDYLKKIIIGSLFSNIEFLENQEAKMNAPYEKKQNLFKLPLLFLVPPQKLALMDFTASFGDEKNETAIKFLFRVRLRGIKSHFHLSVNEVP